MTVFNKKHYKNFYLKILDMFLLNDKKKVIDMATSYTTPWIASNNYIWLLSLKKNLRKIKNFLIFYLFFYKIFNSKKILPKTKKFLFLYKPSYLKINYY